MAAREARLRTQFSTRETTPDSDKAEIEGEGQLEHVRADLLHPQPSEPAPEPVTRWAVAQLEPRPPQPSGAGAPEPQPEERLQPQPEPEPEPEPDCQSLPPAAQVIFSC
eukprot:203917-Rhodomonas_salina.1